MADVKRKRCEKKNSWKFAAGNDRSTCSSKLLPSNRGEFINRIAALARREEETGRCARGRATIRNLADRSLSIIGDFLLFDGHLITEINPFTARARVHDETNALKRSFVGRVTHGDRHAKQLTTAGLLTAKYDGRLRINTLQYGRDAYKTNEN